MTGIGHNCPALNPTVTAAASIPATIHPCDIVVFETGAAAGATAAIVPPWEPSMGSQVVRWAAPAADPALTSGTYAFPSLGQRCDKCGKCRTCGAEIRDGC